MFEFGRGQDPKKTANRLASMLRERDEAERHVRMLGCLVEESSRAHREMLDSLRWRAGSRAVRLVELLLRKPNHAQSSRRLAATLDRHDTWKRDRADRLSCRVPGWQAESLIAQLRSGKETDAAPVAERLVREANDAANETLRLCRVFEEIQSHGEMMRASWRWKVGRILVGGLAKLCPRVEESRPVVEADVLARSFVLWRDCYGGQNRVTTTVHTVWGAHATANGGLEPVEAERVRALRVTQFTPPAPRNPFYRIVADELRRRGWAFDFTVRFEDLLRPAANDEERQRIVHFHQFDALYHDRGGNLDATRRAAGELLDRLAELKQAGHRLVHTFHNPWPHDRRFLEIDREFTESALPLMDGVMVLSENARPFVAKYAEPQRIHVIAHPSYAGVYGPECRRDEARHRLGLPPNAFVFGHLGELKPYKGVEEILAAFHGAQPSMPDSMLVIAGRPADADYAAQLKALAGKSDRVRLEMRLLEDEEIPLWLGAFDFSVFAFRDIWVSGSVILSQSYGVPVVVPELGGLPEYVTEEDTGFLYAPDGPSALAEAMMRARRTPYMEHLRYMCGVQSQKRSVEAVATACEHFYAAAAAAGPDGA